VVDTLEASVWCLLNTGSFEEAVPKAVNLGEDTDTTAAVTGGLAGVHYGPDGIPQRWIDQIAWREDLRQFFETFAGVSAG
jgi:ADP-ribosyl-[dinitrogen reductase] hydrolase